VCVRACAHACRFRYSFVRFCVFALICVYLRLCVNMYDTYKRAYMHLFIYIHMYMTVHIHTSYTHRRTHIRTRIHTHLYTHCTAAAYPGLGRRSHCGVTPSLSTTTCRAKPVHFSTQPVDFAFKKFLAGLEERTFWANIQILLLFSTPKENSYRQTMMQRAKRLAVPAAILLSVAIR